MCANITIERKDTDYLGFYKNLPSKICSDCGYDIIEQHELYLNKCEQCIKKEYDWDKKWILKKGVTKELLNFSFSISTLRIKKESEELLEELK